MFRSIVSGLGIMEWIFWGFLGLLVALPILAIVWSLWLLDHGQSGRTLRPKSMKGHHASIAHWVG